MKPMCSFKRRCINFIIDIIIKNIIKNLDLLGQFLGHIKQCLTPEI